MEDTLQFACPELICEKITLREVFFAEGAMPTIIPGGVEEKQNTLRQAAVLPGLAGASVVAAPV
jgi:hypothetical protein